MGTIKKGRVDHDKTKNPIAEPQMEYDDNGNLILNESNLGKKKYEELVQDNPDLPTDRPPTVDDLPPSDIKAGLEKVAENEQKNQEIEFHDHLRYFARAIPMILMAYGKQDTKLSNFEKYIDTGTFQELVGISKQQFQDLRDKYQLFNEEVFNACITEFLSHKAELADYYENDRGLDIFDYIPPQQTNQIYTPKAVVEMMIDNLEKQSPEIFKSKDNTFLDPYMKSGLFITEIVKRLYNNLENRIPDKNQRLEHILTKQVYGFAPSKILHLISNETIFGFMHGQPEFKKMRYRVEKNFVWFENEDELVTKNKGALSDRINTEWSQGMKFTAVVGNPPYQESATDNNRHSPIYHLFMEEAFSLANRVSLITPGRFLFNAGQTPETWNIKMLSDKHLRVIYYESVSSKVFPNTDIKGGVVVTYRDTNQDFGPIGAFTTHKEMTSIIPKVLSSDFKSIADLLYVRSSYKFTPNLLQQNPVLKGRSNLSEERSIGSNIFDKYSEIFFDEEPVDGDEYIRILGRHENQRVYKWIKREYIASHPNLEKWKVYVAKSNGTGAFGEALSTPQLGEPHTGATQTFISFGAFDKSQDAKNLLSYLKTKFARTLLGTKKATPDNAKKSVWENVPLQNFSANSSIDWTQTLADLDKQLYAKYGLNEEEVAFIETRVKAME
jgi:hypothetical protein